jgi:serine/threonine protein phosphatase 1
MLFVHAGIDPTRSLEAQEGSFWWAGKQFNQIELEYAPFHKVIRGFDPDHNGMRINCVTATIDGGCGFGGALVCAGFDNKAAIFDLIEA